MPGTLVITTLSDGTNSTSATNCIQGSAKAWVNYNADTQTIRGSFNVSSITYSSAGSYVMNFTTAMPNANYCPVVNSSRAAPNQLYYNAHAVATSTTACSILNGLGDSYSGAIPGDSSTIGVAIFSS
jgi:hypothetical protein